MHHWLVCIHTMHHWLICMYVMYHWLSCIYEMHHWLVAYPCRVCRCIVGHTAAKFDATRGAVLANIAELLVRQLERKWAESEARQSDVQLMRSLACYDEAFMFLDTSRQGNWRVLHMNRAASKLLGKES